MFACPCRPPGECAGLVERHLRANDPAAADALLRSLDGEILNFLRSRYPGRGADVDDCAQAARIRVWAKMPRWTGRAPFCHWAFVVTLRVAIDFDRASATNRAPTMDPATLPARPWNDPVMRDCIERVAAEFPGNIKALYELKTNNDLTHEEIARLEGVTVATVQNRLRSMRALLSPCLEQD